MADVLFLALDETVRRAHGYADKGSANYWAPLYDQFCKDRKAFVRAVADRLEGE